MAFNILILEDDEAFQKILEMRLRSWISDPQITSVSSLLDAREELDDQPEFNLAILDQHLPDGLGWELIEHPKLHNTAVLAVSSDSSPELPGQTLRAGAQHFLDKRQVSQPLFRPLVEALVARKKLEAELIEGKIRESKIRAVNKLLATLQHEVNNPLGAVLGGTYLMRISGNLDEDQQSALSLIEESGKRIKHVLEQLIEATDLEEVSKGNEEVYQVPGDKPWSS